MRVLGFLLCGLVIVAIGACVAYADPAGTPRSRSAAINSGGTGTGSGGSGSGVQSVSGTAPIVSSGGTTPALSCTAASGSVAGCLSSTDWSTFNGKESALTFSAPISRTSNTVSCTAASGSVAGCLSSTDWNTFNGKESALTFSAPLSRTSNTVSCTSASSGAAGCVTSTGQEFSGLKGFINGVNALYVDAGVVFTPAIQNLIANQTLTLKSSVGGTVNQCDVTIDTDVDRSEGKLMCFANHGSTLSWVDSSGTGAFPRAAANEFVPYSGSAGLAFTSNRTSADSSPDFTFNSAHDRNIGINLIELRNNGNLKAYITTQGAVYAAADVLAPADFVSTQSDPTHPTIVCTPGVSGCYGIWSGGMLNTGQHAPLTIANTGPVLPDGGIECSDTSVTCNRFRDGGWMVDVQATGRETHNHHIYVLDDLGNQYTNGTWSSRIADTARQVCQSTVQWDPEMRGVGQVGFYTDDDQLEVCTARSARESGDGGYERVLTDGTLFPDDQTGAPPRIRHGTSSCSGSTKAISFTTAFTTTPDCLLTSKTSGHVYVSTGPSSSGFTATCAGASDGFMWHCEGK